MAHRGGACRAWAPALPLTVCVAWDKHFSVTLFSHLGNGNNMATLSNSRRVRLHARYLPYGPYKSYEAGNTILPLPVCR